MHANFRGVHWCQVVMERCSTLYKLSWPSVVSGLDPSVTEAMTPNALNKETGWTLDPSVTEAMMPNALNKETGWTLQWQKQWYIVLWTKKQAGPFSERSNNTQCVEQRVRLDPSVTESVIYNALNKETGWTLQWQNQWYIMRWTKRQAGPWTFQWQKQWCLLLWTMIQGGPFSDRSNDT